MITFDEKHKTYDEDTVMYLIHKSGFSTYEVAKFVDGEPAPSAVYTVIEGHNGRWSCNCPGHRHGSTKHIQIVKDWLRRGCPLPVLFEGSTDIMFHITVE